MVESVDICRLEYLAGTLSTAYRGVITSLVMKDFCMTKSNGSVSVHGKILAMPPGEYQAGLMHGGKELARSGLREGYFEFSISAEILSQAKNLQIDIVQSGRHIGTFLLKKEQTGGFFSSAIELSRDVQGIPFKSLTGPLEDRIGLSQKAERLIADIFSPKKDWEKLSEEIHLFSEDLFWYDPRIYSRWYELLVRYSRVAAERVQTENADRAFSNFLSLLELPLDKEADQKRVRVLAENWLRELASFSDPVSSRLGQAGRDLAAVHARFPELDLVPALSRLLSSLQERVQAIPSLPDNMLARVRDLLPPDDFARLSEYSEWAKQRMLTDIDRVRKNQTDKRYIPEALDTLVRHGPRLLDSAKIWAQFFEIIEKNIFPDSASVLMASFLELYAKLMAESPGMYKNLAGSAFRAVHKFIGLKMPALAGILFDSLDQGPDAIRQSILLNPETAEAVVRAGDKQLTLRYVSGLQKILIPAPMHAGFSHETWAELVNPAHLERLSHFLRILERGDEDFRPVLIHVICNLFVSGVFIPDDKLFQRQISSYLNSPALQSNFLFNYLLLKKMPVYFNEVGATGRIRDDTTRIDSWGNDPVLYFLRKQVHANASNYNVRLIEAILRSWTYHDAEFLRGSAPEDVIQTLDRSLNEQYADLVRPLFESLQILDEKGLHLERILALPEDEIEKALDTIGGPDELRSKIFLLCRIYRDVVGKYSFFADHRGNANVARAIAEDIGSVFGLKQKILSPEKTESQESLFFKRHIAFGIPSVLGTYHEPKFDALGELFRREARIRVLFEKIILEIQVRGERFTTHDLEQWLQYLDSVNRLLTAYDLGNFQVEEVLTIFRTNTLRVSQVLDLFRICQRELTWAVEFFYRTFHGPLLEILKRFPRSELPDYLKKLGPEDDNFIHKATDIIIRDMVNSVVGFTELDRLLIALTTMLKQYLMSGKDELIPAQEVPEIRPQYFILDRLSDREAMIFAPVLGGKAKNLVYMRNRQLPVPSGIVLSAEHTHRYEEYTNRSEFRAILRASVQEIERQAGLGFGDCDRPLFLSVRSGSYISMPGILSSILYCGMNRETVAGLIAMSGDERFGWDSYRRFIEDYGTIVRGVPSRMFEIIRSGVQKSRNTKNLDALDAGGMEEIVHHYEKELAQNGHVIPEEVYDQLAESVGAVYRSWYNTRALQFRSAMDISSEWGTSVMIMQMISGNAPGSGASVFFTRTFPSLERRIYGETRAAGTGEDLASGKLTNQPLSTGQKAPGRKSLEETDPELFRKHQELAASIESAFRGLPQEVEATYSRDRSGNVILYVLQTKRMEFHRGFTKRFRDVCRMESNIIGRGTGVFGGALSGVATFSTSPEEIRKLKNKQALPVILFRQSASTDDVSLMPEINGLVTAAGGMTSHAAILAQKFKITAIVGCSGMTLRRSPDESSFAEFGPASVTDGTPVSIDGSTGLVYRGICTFTEEGGL